MGIKDLLRFMKPYTEPTHIRKYSGSRVGIDAYSWLHKGAYSCSMELCLDSEGDKKFQYISYFMHRVNLLRHHNITPVVVFDGGNIPCKAGTENERYRRRKANKELAMQKLREGNVTGATELFQRAISITTSMAHQLIQVLRTENVEFMVAPYEADAQLAYLSSLREEQGGIRAVITEDSDLLAYGCPSIIFKMDRFGNGEEIVLKKVFSSTNIKPSFRNYTTILFTEMCVLAGCDFLPSVPGIGIAKAHSLVSKYRNINRVLSVLKFEKGKKVPEDYASSFREAVAVFQHASVFNINEKRLDHMKQLPAELLAALGGEVDFLGPEIPPRVATAIAEGNLDPITMEAYECSLSYRNQKCVAATQTSELPKKPASVYAAVSRCTKYSSKGAREGSKGTISRAAEGKNQILKGKKSSNEGAALVKKAPLVEFHGDDETQTESCFTVYSSRTTMEDNITSTITAMLPRQVLKERNFSDEAAALAKLAPLEVFSNGENTAISEGLPLNTPDNNPFHKRKRCSETAITTPNSGVTECDKLQLQYQSLNSQESVTSKPKKSDDKNEEGNHSKIPNTSFCKSSKNRKISILNFFACI